MSTRHGSGSRFSSGCKWYSFNSDGPLDVERRRATRRTVASDEPLAQAKLRAGGQLVVLDASNWGVLTETTARLLPGRHLDVHIVTPTGRTLVRSRVARAYVCRVQPDAIHYHAALAFEQVVDTRPCGSPVPAVLVSMTNAREKAYSDCSDSGDIVFDERHTA